MKILLFPVILIFVLIPFELFAQTYGGFAQVYKTHSDGTASVIFGSWPCVEDDPSSVKKHLNSILKNQTYSDERISSDIDYEIDECHYDETTNLKGSASVSVQNKSGNTRKLKVEISCAEENITDIKDELIDMIWDKRRSDERYIGFINFQINYCN
jgi:hypothetical protein